MGVSKASLRGLRMNERMEKIREANKAMVRVVSVSPANDDMRRLLKHPSAGGFPKSGAATWPDDRFTQRRVADGDITRETDKKTESHDRQHERRGTTETHKPRGQHREPDEPRERAADQPHGDEPNSAA
jgi:hypothetical protein